MAWIYDLTVEFGTNEKAAKAFAAAISKRLTGFESGTKVTRLHPPSLVWPKDEFGDRVHISVIPVGVSHGLPADKGETVDFGDDVPPSLAVALLNLLKD